MKHCYCRHNDGVYLQTCWQPAGHQDQHQTEDGGCTWPQGQGWWDEYGDQPELACAPAEPEPEPEAEPEQPPPTAETWAKSALDRLLGPID